MAKLFISYSHRDEKARDQLHKHLAMLSRDKLITAWYDREILAGGDIDREIASNLSDSDIFLALVSPDFIDSKYCYDIEMTSALGRHDEGSARVIPVILEPCDWKSSPLGKLKALPKDGKPISLWANENVAYLDIATEIRRILASSEQNVESRSSSQEHPRAPSTRPQRRYRIKKDFDAIDREEFREKTFATIYDYFALSIDELNQVGDPIRARLEKMSESAFSCTVLNKAARNREANITVHSEGMLGDITYSFSRRAAPNTANGSVHIEANEYELYLTLNQFSGLHEKQSLSAEQVAEVLWQEFVGHAGIDHD